MGRSCRSDWSYGSAGGVWCVPARWCVPVVCASSMVCAGGVCQLCAAARSRRLLIKQAVLPPNPDQTTRARCCRLVLGAYLANFSGFFFALFFFSRPLLLDTPKADKAMRLGVLESRYHALCCAHRPFARPCWEHGSSFSLRCLTRECAVSGTSCVGN